MVFLLMIIIKSGWFTAKVNQPRKPGGRFLSQNQFGGLFLDSYDIYTACIDRNLVAAGLQFDAPSMTCNIADRCALLNSAVDNDVLSLGRDFRIHRHFMHISTMIR